MSKNENLRTNITVLDLGESGAFWNCETTGNENIIAFMKFLARLKKLRWLNLEKSNIPTEMIELLGKNPVMKTLKRLIIRNISFSGETRAKSLA